MAAVQNCRNGAEESLPTFYTAGDNQSPQHPNPCFTAGVQGRCSEPLLNPQQRGHAFPENDFDQSGGIGLDGLIYHGGRKGGPEHQWGVVQSGDALHYRSHRQDISLLVQFEPRIRWVKLVVAVTQCGFKGLNQRMVCRVFAAKHSRGRRTFWVSAK